MLFTPCPASMAESTDVTIVPRDLALSVRARKLADTQANLSI